MGSVNKCATESGEFGECAPARLTVHGEPCSLPFPYNGKNFRDCVPVDGKMLCRTVLGIMGECSPLKNQNVEQIPKAVNPSLVDNVLSRATVDGDTCSFPFWHEGEGKNRCLLLHYCTEVFCTILHCILENR